MATVLTIGHSNHPIDRFLELLAKHGVEALVDIRRFPGSRKHPQFNRKELQAAIEQSGLEYCWIEELGGRRKPAVGETSPNQGWRNAAFRNYADHMLSAEFQHGIEKLLAVAAARRAAILCAEGLWWQCHRRLVSDYLLAHRVAVEHIFPNGSLKPHQMTPGAIVEEGRVTYPGSKGLFDDEDESD